MKFKNTITVLLVVGLGVVYAQNPKSKADAYFFQYSYKDAVLAYENDMALGFDLTKQQQLNLADSYFKTNDFQKASDIYTQLYANDSIMNDLQFNRMLQSIEKTSDDKKLNGFIQDSGSGLTKELLENADFNNRLLSNGDEGELKFEIFSLAANSPKSDFSASFYGEGIVFTSGRPNGKREDYVPMGEAYLDIYEGEMDENGQVNSARVFNKIQPSDYHKATPYYSETLNGFFYIRSNTDENGDLSYDENDKNSLAIVLQRDQDQVRPLLKDLSTSFYYPFYDIKTQRLYFAADFESGYGGTDIYFVYTNNGQVMSAPINLGPRINSPGNEISPYIFDGSLYFSSDIFYGLGGMDIYKSNISGDDFSVPINLGPSINSVEDDFGFIIRDHGDGLLGYFSSNRDGGMGKDDIYGFMVDEKPGIRTFALKGQVVNKANFGKVAQAMVRVFNDKGELLQEVLSNDEGGYSIEVPLQESVRIEATKDRYSVFSVFFQGEEMKSVQQTALNIGLVKYDDIVEEREGQTVLKLNRFYFAKSKTNITADIANELNKVVEAVERFPQIQLRIETHTDSRGGSSLNFRLTQQRSDNIKKYLIEKGVPESNIIYTIGYGEDKILNNCTNGVYCIDYLHKENQRSLIVVLNDNILFD